MRCLSRDAIRCDLGGVGVFRGALGRAGGWGTNGKLGITRPADRFVCDWCRTFFFSVTLGMILVRAKGRGVFFGVAGKASTLPGTDEEGGREELLAKLMTNLTRSTSFLMRPTIAACRFLRASWHACGSFQKNSLAA